MDPTRPSLGAQIAGLREAVQAQENHAWIPDAIHALIIACLARIFSRLERMIQLWQDGQLPPLPHPAHRPHTSAPRPRTPRLRTSRNRTRSCATPRKKTGQTQAAPAAPPAPATQPTRQNASAPAKHRPRATPRAPPNRKRPSTRITAARPKCYDIAINSTKPPPWPCPPSSAIIAGLPPERMSST